MVAKVTSLRGSTNFLSWLVVGPHSTDGSAVPVITLCNVCSVHRGMFSTSGGCSVHRGDTMSTSGDILSTSGDILSTSRDVQHISEYHDSCGGTS